MINKNSANNSQNKQTSAIMHLTKPNKKTSYNAYPDYKIIINQANIKWLQL